MSAAATFLRTLLSAPTGNRYRALAVTALVFLGGVFPAYLGIETTRGIMAPGPRSVSDLLMNFDRQGFDLDAVREGQGEVPRILLPALPRDWRRLAGAVERKRAFTMVVLPLVLHANEKLSNERGYLLALSAKIDANEPLKSRERTWILELAAQYRIEASDVSRKLLKILQRRVDIVPPSLAIAQAAIESGWGTSRFATEGNALFGQWDEESDATMIPAGRDTGRTYAIRRFDSLLESVKEYMRNLNSHRAYRKFRAARARSRAAGLAITGPSLAKLLGQYSQQGPRYIKALTSIIEKDSLDQLDSAVLKL